MKKIIYALIGLFCLLFAGFVQADLSSPSSVNSSTQSALNLKADKASPTFTGTVTAAAVTTTGAINHGGTVSLNGAFITNSTVTHNGSVTPVGRMIMPVGQVDYFNTTGTLITIASASDGSTNLVAITPATTGLFDTCFDNGGSNNGSLRYTCATTKYAHIAITLSGTPQTANDVFVFGVAKNGTVGTGCKVMGSTSGTQFSALHCIMQVAQNDVITVRVGNITAGNNITIKSLNVQAVLM